MSIASFQREHTLLFQIKTEKTQIKLHLGKVTVTSFYHQNDGVLKTL